MMRKMMMQRGGQTAMTEDGKPGKKKPNPRMARPKFRRGGGGKNDDKY